MGSAISNCHSYLGRAGISHGRGFEWRIDRRSGGGNLARMADNRRSPEYRDRRAVPRGGRRDGDQKKPWYLRRRLWLAVASVMFVGWRRVTGRTKAVDQRDGSDVAA
jgi:hypothetical protein